VLAGIVIVLFSWVYRDMPLGEPFFIGDLSPWYSSTGEVWSHFLSAWSDTNLGWANPLTYGLAVVQFTFILLTGNASAGQHLFFLSLLPLSIATMYVLLRYMVQSSATRIIIALSYGLNGATIAWFSVGAHPFLTVLVSFPLLFLFFLKYLRDPEHRNRNLLIFTAIAALETGLMPYLVIRLVPILTVPFIIEIVRRRSHGYLISTMVGLAIAGVGYAILTAPLLVRQFQAIIPALGSTNGTIGLSSARNINEAVETLHKNFNTPYTLELLQYSFYLIIVLAVLSFVFTTRERWIWYAGFVTVATVVMFFMHTIAWGSTLFVFQWFPFLLPFQDPSKLQSIMMLASFLAAALLLEELAQRKVAFKAPHFHIPQVHVLAGLLLFVGGLFGVMTEAYPPYDNERTNLARFLTTGLARDSTVTFQVPEAYANAASWIRTAHEEEHFFRTLWLPDNRHIQRNVLPIYDPPSFRRPDDPLLTRLALEPLYFNQTNHLGQALGRYGVKYIVVIDPEWEWSRWVRDTTGYPRYVAAAEQGFLSTGDPEIYFRELAHQEDLLLVHEEEGVSIFENLAFQPHISAYSATLTVAPFELLQLESASDGPVLGETNLLANGGFEDGLDGWRTSIAPASSYAIEQTVDGKPLLRMTAPQRPQFSAITQEVPINDEALYSLSTRMRGANTNRVSFRIYFRNESGESIPVAGSSSLRIWISLEPGWNDHAFNLNPPAGSKALFVSLESEAARYAPAGSLGDLWVKKVHLDQVVSGLPPPTADERFVGTPSAGPPGLAPRLEYVPQLLESLPYEDPANTLLLLGDLERGEPSVLAARSDAVIFLGSPNSDAALSAWVKEANALILLYEAESVLIPRQKFTGGSRSIVTAGNQYSYDSAVAIVGPWETEMKFHAPISGFYRIVIRSNGPVPQVSLAGLESVPVPIGEVKADLQWYETESIFLEPGSHLITFRHAKGKGSVDQVMVIQTPLQSTSAAQLFVAPDFQLSVTQRNPGEFVASVQSEGPYTLLFREAYNNGWNALGPDGELEHLALGPLGWANGFFSENGGDQEIVIKYDGQDTRHRAIALWMTGWVVVAAWIALLVFPRPSRPYAVPVGDALRRWNAKLNTHIRRRSEEIAPPGP
jgi:hypothetical protein